MICKKCGAETLVENAVFCGECGTRLDGKIKCRACGEFNEETTKFCVYCGTRIDGKKVCECGAVYDSKFCPICGKGETEQTPVQSIPAPKKKASSVDKTALWNKIFGLASGGVALLGVLFAMIFVFFIGLMLSVSSDFAGLGIAIPQVAECNIFYYFGDAYKEIADAGALVAEYGISANYADVLTSAMTTTAIFGTVVSVVTICGVIGFAVPAIISYVKYATGQAKKTGAGWSIASMLVFLLGAAAFYTLNVLTASIAVDASGSTLSMSVTEISVGIAFNKATVTGIVMVAIFFALFIAASFVSFGKEWKKASFIKTAIFTVVGGAITFVVFAIMQDAYVGIAVADGASMNKITVNGSLTYGMTIFLSVISTLSNKVVTAAEGCITAAFVCQLLELVFVLAILVCAAMSILERVKNVNGAKNTGLVWNIVITALSVGVLVCGIVGQAQLPAVMEAYYEYAHVAASEQVQYTVAPAAAIVGLVFAQINLAISIVQAAICKDAASAKVE